MDTKEYVEKFKEREKEKNQALAIEYFIQDFYKECDELISKPNIDFNMAINTLRKQNEKWHSIVKSFVNVPLTKFGFESFWSEKGIDIRGSN